MSGTGWLSQTSLRKHALIMGAMFEVFFAYLVFRSWTSSGSSLASYWWLVVLVKVGLGYLTFRLYTSRRKKLAVVGSLLAVGVVATTYIVFLTSPQGLSVVFGSYFVYMLTANTLFLFWYYRSKEALKSAGGKSLDRKSVV